jgi:hypothetical protein
VTDTRGPAQLRPPRVIGPFLARSVTGWGAVLRRLLAPLADAFREIDDLATLHDAVTSVGVHRA